MDTRRMMDIMIIISVVVFITGLVRFQVNIIAMKKNVKGVVKSVRCESRGGQVVGSEGPYLSQVVKCEIKYEFKAKGMWFEGIAHETKKAGQGGYKEGDEVDVVYNENNPRKNNIDTVKVQVGWPVMMGSGFLLFLGASMFKAGNRAIN